MRRGAVRGKILQKRLLRCTARPHAAVYAARLTSLLGSYLVVCSSSLIRNSYICFRCNVECRLIQHGDISDGKVWYDKTKPFGNFIVAVLRIYLL